MMTCPGLGGAGAGGVTRPEGNAMRLGSTAVHACGAADSDRPTRAQIQILLVYLVLKCPARRRGT
jgi:hypothetical protein